MWEDYHSEINQVGSVVFPAPPIADFLGLRIANGSSDMRDRDGRTATLYRVCPGPGFGSHFLFMRRDLLDAYLRHRRMRLVHSVSGERSMNNHKLEHDLPDNIRRLFEDGVNRFANVSGLDK